ncbi:MAG TPA: LysR family transcriptional regulator [Gammaproteobacteria bacterium]|nr:LysR family transcriptional regulator [Gammaproteobacteria bacterium]HIK70366.1 LysR family transcriptional regulator [Pseudomonadales bacterium]
MELRHLKYFVAVAETKSLSNAIKRLHIAQPALSHSIKNLEEELDTALFIRSRKGMELTGTGESFLISAKSILNEVARAKESVKEAEQNPSGSVSIIIVPSVSSVLSVPLFREVKKHYPNIVLRIDESTTLDIRQSFDTGALDLLVYFTADGVENIEIEPLLREELYLASQYNQDHQLPKEIEFSQLSGYPLMFPQVSQHVDRTIADTAKKLGVRVDVHPSTVAISTLIKLVRAGVTCGVVPWSLIYESVNNGELNAAKIVNPSVQRTINLISPTNRHRSNATIVVMNLIRQITRQLHAKRVWRGQLLVD